MKIATKKGDNLTTSLLFGGGRKNKGELVFEVLGNYDELSAFIGLLKVKIEKWEVDHKDALSKYPKMLENIQLDLIKIMGELNCENEGQVSKYISKFDPLTHENYRIIDDEVSFLQEIPELEQRTWVLYGKTEIGALADICSKVARRAERQLAILDIFEHVNHRSVIKEYANRLSDLFYLIARFADFTLKK